MYRKKYGRMTTLAWMSAEIRQTSPALAVIVGCLCAIVYVIVRGTSGHPYGVMLALGISDLVPPVWLMTVLRFLSFFTVGCAAGLVLGWRERGCAGEKYRAGMLFLLLVALELCWYPTLFVSALVFLAVLESLMILVRSLLVTVGFFRVSRLAGVILTLHCVWVIYLMILTFSIFFRN
ncbi:MAG: tryptophan-rich sensory protein [Eubacteriales bacterium]|nr:tryptophan-rich sensory protein [Eubacteriales bacterium]